MAVKRNARREDALIGALSVTDTSRRVGWAKYYSSTERVDDLSHDLNVAKTDIDLISRFAGYLYGALGVVAPTVIGKLPPSIDRLGVLSMLPSESIRIGRKLARKQLVSRGDLAKSGMTDRELIHFTSEILRDRKQKRADSPQTMGETIDISSPDQPKVLTVASRSDGGIRLSRGKSRVYIDSDELLRLVDILASLPVS